MNSNQKRRAGSYSPQIKFLPDDMGVAAVLIHHGLVPTAPFFPYVAISTRTLELFQTTHMRCPHLAIQPFVKSLCDLHGVPFRPTLARQFSIAFDVYLQLRQEIFLRVRAILKRDTPIWRLQNACPACTYKVKGEDFLIFKMLVTMDGNDSLKRVLRRDPTPNIEDDGDTPLAKNSIEQLDERDAGSDYYISRAQVDRWAKALMQGLLPSESKDVNDDEDENPCAGRWSNMVNEVTARMWGIFDETGIFLALCRHGFVLVVVDMVCSGELYVQPL